MRVAALYDVHGNLPALEAVLRDVRRAGATEVVVGGDVVPGPMPRASLDRLLALELPVRFLRGNGESAVLTVMAGAEPTAVPEPFREPVRWVARQLGREHEEVLAAWPSTIRVDITGLGAVLFCHATPQSETAIFTRRTPEEALLPVFASVAEPIVVCGHTHMQFDRRVGPTRVVNAGSVGMPFGRTGADWLLLGPGVELRHTDYDLVGAATAIRSSGYPGSADHAERFVLATPSEEDMLAAFSRAELRP